uniref:TIL domain-containing protein n=1 Tax=Bursaphelenchus xylophilus TaxID=6326 RepID=A0A1I7RV04_BURXY
MNKRLILTIFLVSLSGLFCRTTKKPDYGAPDGPQDKRCPKNQYFHECTTDCPPKGCDNILQVSPCVSLHCGEPKCECKHGFVLLSSKNPKGECVRRETCLQLQRKANEDKKKAKTNQ